MMMVEMISSTWQKDENSESCMVLQWREPLEKKYSRVYSLVTLSTDPEKWGWAVKASSRTRLSQILLQSTWADESIINTEVFYSLQSLPSDPAISSSDILVIDNALSGSLTDPNLNPSYSWASSTGSLL